jgi:glycosyltransferase involved in cell wall biosynthesis
MSVVLMVNGDLGKTGTTGDIAERAAQACIEHGIPVRVICRSARWSGVPADRVSVVFPFFRQLSLLLNCATKVWGLRVNSYHIRRGLFERFTVGKILPCSIFHCWDLYERGFARAKQLGATTVLEPEMDIWRTEWLSNVDYVIAASTWICEKARLLGFPEHRVFYRPFGVDTGFFRPSAPPDEPKRFMFSGILSDRKGVRELLEAWNKAQLKDCVLVLCGRRTPFFRRAMKELQPKHVEMKGFLTWEQLREEYRRAYAFVLVSKKDNSVKAHLEALACGLPAVVTPETGSVITHGKEGFLVSQSDTSAIADAMRCLAAGGPGYHSMRDAARQTAERFSWEAYQKRTIELYREIGRQRGFSIDR